MGRKPAMSTLTCAPSRPFLGTTGLGERCKRLCTMLELAFAVRRERRALCGLDERALKDLGFTASDAAREANRAWFDLPQDRLQG